jgi:hypothetical protein
MDAQFWVYVIIAIIYGLSRLLKKPENAPPDVGEQRPGRPVKYNPTPSAEKSKPLTFEELLKEITEAKVPKAPETVSMPRQDYVDYDENIPDERQSLEELSTQRREEESRRTQDVYEEAKRQAFARPSLEETLRLSDTRVQFGKFKEFELKKERNLIEEYSLNFKDPEGLKRAFIMSEILNRKF